MKNKKIVQKIVLGGVIVKSGKILIIQRHKDESVFPNMWELPSGKRKPLESSEHSLLREIKEETGLSIEIIMPFSIFDYTIKDADKIKDSTQINFLVKPKGKKIVILSHEHQAFAWVDEKEINKYKTSEATKKTIKEAFKLLPKIVK